MGSVNTPNPKLAGTTRIFDDYYQFQFDVQDQEYDAVYSYFKSIYTTKQAAGNFTVTLFRISAEHGIPVMNLLSQMQGQSGAEVTLTLAYYLNSMRSSSTLVGVSATVQPNFYVARNVRA
jgi:hypothetical protein